jgi:hypothetical protein
MPRTVLPIAATLLLWAASTPLPAAGQTRDREPRTIVVEVRDQGFHWADAGIGALATLGVVVAGAGATLVIRRGDDRRRRRAAASRATNAGRS